MSRGDVGVLMLFWHFLCVSSIFQAICLNINVFVAIFCPVVLNRSLPGCVNTDMCKMLLTVLFHCLFANLGRIGQNELKLGKRCQSMEMLSCTKFHAHKWKNCNVFGPISKFHYIIPCNIEDVSLPFIMQRSMGLTDM